MNDPPRLHIYFDDLRAGHAYFELFAPGETEGTLYGFYPKSFDGEKEIFFDAGEVRGDRNRLEKIRQRTDLHLVSGETTLSPHAYERLCAHLDEQRADPPRYRIAGSNCIEFIQAAYRYALDDDAANFLELFERDALLRVSWVGPYALARYPF